MPVPGSNADHRNHITTSVHIEEQFSRNHSGMLSITDVYESGIFEFSINFTG